MSALGVLGVDNVFHSVGDLAAAVDFLHQDPRPARQAHRPLEQRPRPDRLHQASGPGAPNQLTDEACLEETYDEDLFVSAVRERAVILAA